MLSIDQSACHERCCVNFLGTRCLNQSIDEMSEVFYCKAFPDGIPGAIQSGSNPHFCRLSEQDNEITFELDMSRASNDFDDFESTLLTTFALTVDGYALASDLKGQPFGEVYEDLCIEFKNFMENLNYDKTPEYLRMMLFFIQRGEIREGRLAEGDAMLGVAREIFLRTCNTPRPRPPNQEGFIDDFIKKFECHYKPRLDQYKEFIRRRHEAQSYRAYSEDT